MQLYVKWFCPVSNSGTSLSKTALRCHTQEQHNPEQHPVPNVYLVFLSCYVCNYGTKHTIVCSIVYRYSDKIANNTLLLSFHALCICGLWNYFEQCHNCGLWTTVFCTFNMDLKMELSFTNFRLYV